jgi:uncharacterized protein/heat shock protein HslJ
MLISRPLLFAIFCLALASCQHVAPPQSRVELETIQTSELSDTHWQLVIIQSMDDSEFKPKRSQDYTLKFDIDGRLLVQSNCNRGVGNWTSENTGQLEFGPIALTRMACPPGSIDGRFNSDLSYVRSYIMKDGRLYLATMADGSILEFERFGKPSFNCDAKSGSIETLICQNTELGNLDQKLSQLFALALKTDHETKSLRAFQRGWIKGRNECWKSDNPQNCTEDEYRRRITELEIQTGSMMVPSPVTFHCEDDVLLTVYFYQDTELPAAIMNRGLEQRLMYLTSSASGAQYAGQNVTFWSKGADAQLTWDQKETHCRGR